MKNIIYFEKTESLQYWFDTQGNDFFPISIGFNNFNFLSPYHDNRKIPFHVIHYIIDGEGYFIIHNKRYIVEKNTFFYIPPNTTVNYFPNRLKPYSYFWIDFDGKLANNFLAKSSFSSNSPVFKALDDQFIEKFLNCFHNKNKLSYYSTLALLFEIFNTFPAKNFTDYTLDTNKTYANQIKSFIDSNFTKTITISDIIKSINLSHSYACRVFKNTFGLSIKNYIINCRLSSAEYQLRSTKKTIKEIAHSVGYGDELYFSTAFQKKHGISPSSYRNENTYKIINKEE